MRKMSDDDDSNFLKHLKTVTLFDKGKKKLNIIFIKFVIIDDEFLNLKL